ncbi:hypothetical protein H6P81_017190 [Aristolochia fimbriata]|uniref:Uncharacterized protein n=1 Tax=Aristolochia fimbriata TaxID=158543 RepID=A0AAV7DYT4_ARIFI|nr:hypothetical protein H6P81_017190 [Aristolochia fimbriata]
MGFKTLARLISKYSTESEVDWGPFKCAICFFNQIKKSSDRSCQKTANETKAALKKEGQISGNIASNVSSHRWCTSPSWKKI